MVKRWACYLAKLLNCANISFMFKYGIASALEDLFPGHPVSLRGSIDYICRGAKKIGYDAIELHIYEPKRYDTEEIRRTLYEYGLSICAIANGLEYTLGGLSLIDDDIAVRNAAMERYYEHIDFASALNAGLIVGMMRGNIPRGGDKKIYFDRFTSALEKICGYAKERNVSLFLESIMRYMVNYLCGVKESMDFITTMKKDNLFLHIDTHSMAVEEQNLKDSILYCKNKALGYVHFSENNRMYPGAGALDFKEMTSALMEIGYKGYITIECLPLPNGEESAKRALDYMKAIEKVISIW